jgi:hypothetical protein
LPVNDFASYALLLVVAAVIFSGEVTARAGAWVAVLAIVLLLVAGKFLLAPPRIEEGQREWCDRYNRYPITARVTVINSHMRGGERLLKRNAG